MTELLAKLLPLGLVLLMFVVGLRLERGQLARVIAAPRALGVGLAVQWLGLPLLAIALAAGTGLSADMRAGLILIALAPGGVTSNYIAYLARADLGLSTAMTLITTALIGVTLPLGLTLTGAAVLPEGASLVSISAKMSVVAIGPVLLGLGLSRWVPLTSAALLRVLDPLSKLIFAAMVLATFIQNWEPMRAHLGSVGLAVVALNLTALGLAFCIGWVAGLGRTRTRAIEVEASLQNVALALFVAGALLHNPVLSVPALIYAAIMNVTALYIIWRGRRSEASGV